MLATTLSACYNITFDPLEYDRYVSIKQLADNAFSECGTPVVVSRINELKQSADHQYLYSSNRANRPHIAHASQELRDIVDGIYARYQTGIPSEVYCQEKLHNISDGTTKIIKELGRF